LRADLPETLPLALQQEHIIRVKMGTYATAIHCITHHQIIKPRMRDKIEVCQQSFGSIQMVIELLHQQCPGLFANAFEIRPGKRPVLQFASPVFFGVSTGLEHRLHTIER